MTKNNTIQLLPHVYSFHPFSKPFATWLSIDIQGSYKVAVTIRSIDSPYKLGIGISLSGEPAFKGKVLVDGNIPLSSKRKRQVHVAPVDQEQNNTFILDANVKNGRLSLSPASDLLGDYPGMLEKIAAVTGKPLDSLPNSSFTSGFASRPVPANCFIPEVISPNTIRCHCNDHAIDEDFNDLIFDIEILEETN